MRTRILRWNRNQSRPAHKFGLAVATFAIVAVACGGGVSSTERETAAAAPPPAPSQQGPQAPDSSFVLFDGGEATLATFRGNPLVVNFWASWCPSCVAEMSAAFKPAQEQLGEEVTFVGMNIQDERDLALELLEDTGVKWISAEDATGALYLELGGIGMPFTAFISANGEVLETHNGPLNESQLLDRITEVFGV